MKFLSSLYVLTLLFCTNTFSQSITQQQLSPEVVNGIYKLSVPERGKSEVIVQYGQLGANTVIAVAACKKCTPAVYNYLEEESKTLGVDIFTTSGLYLIRFDHQSFALVQADGVLGQEVWQKIGHANIYSKSADTSKNTNRSEVEKFAIELSQRIMNQEVGKMEHNSGTYYLAVPQNKMNKIRNSYQIEINTEGKKSVTVNPCDRCPNTTYQHMPVESSIIGVDVYVNSGSYYLFDLKDGVFIYTFANARGFGKTLWTKHSRYNVYSNNQAYIRQILTSKEKQNTIDRLMSEYFSKVKNELARRAEESHQEKVANRKLPAEALVYDDKEALLNAAKSWANAWSWVETLQGAYLTQNDWSITRNPLTGIITGKIISGLVTMKHPDGRCRYQILTLRKDYDGSKYMNLHVSGIGPIYDLSCDKLNSH